MSRRRRDKAQAGHSEEAKAGWSCGHHVRGAGKGRAGEGEAHREGGCGHGSVGPERVGHPSTDGAPEELGGCCLPKMATLKCCGLAGLSGRQSQGGNRSGRTGGRGWRTSQDVSSACMRLRGTDEEDSLTGLTET